MESTRRTLSDLFHSFVPPEYRDTGEQAMTPEQLAQRQCEWYNESEGSLTGLDCPECKNRGYFEALDENGYRVKRECRCMAQRRYINMMQSAGLGDLYERCTFDRYIVSADWQRRNKETAMRYAAQDGNAWFLFAGASGCGKTHLCTAICSELAKRGRGIRYVQWRRLYDKLLQTRFKEAEQEQLFAECTDADVLYLDDFLKTPDNIAPSADMLAYALEIVDARYKAEKRTIFSTEFMIDELCGFDEALGGRIRERTLGNKVMNLREAGRNYRMRGAGNGTG